MTYGNPSQNWPQLQQSYFRKAIDADPRNVDAYFYMAREILQGKAGNESAEDVLAAGLKQRPAAPRLLSELVLDRTDQRGPASVDQICQEALGAGGEDRLVMMNCAIAYYQIRLLDKALPLYRKLIAGYDRKKPEFAGATIIENPSISAARILDELHKPNEAAEIMDAYVASIPSAQVVENEVGS